MDYSTKALKNRKNVFETLDKTELVIQPSPLLRNTQNLTLEQQVMRIMRASGAIRPSGVVDDNDDYLDDDLDDLESFVFDNKLTKYEEAELQATAPTAPVSDTSDPVPNAPTAGHVSQDKPTPDINARTPDAPTSLSTSAADAPSGSQQN